MPPAGGAACGAPGLASLGALSSLPPRARALPFAGRPAGAAAAHRGEPRLFFFFSTKGYFVFSREFFNYLSNDESCVMEREPLEKLTLDGQLGVYSYQGFWQCMDTYRDYQYLNELWENKNAAWKVW